MSSARQSWAPAFQGTLYALVIYGTLWLIARLLGQAFDTQYQLMALLMSATGFVVLGRYDLLTPWMPGRQGSVGTRLYWAWVVMVGVLLLIGFLTQYSIHFSRRVLLLWFVSTPVALLIVHKLAVALAQRFLPHIVRRRTAVVVFVNDSARSLSRNLQNSRAFELVGFFEDREIERIGGPLEGVSYLGRARDTAQYVRDHAIDVVFIVLPDDGARRALNLLEDLGNTTASVYYVPDFMIINLFEAQIREIEGVTVLEVAETPFYGADGILKQLFDFVFAATLLILLAPLMIVVAALIKLTSPGPVIFKQRRYGLNGQRFHIYKFRSMHVGEVNRDPDMQQATRQDPRITAIGRFIRRTSIDELPQFFNVLRGDMSVVGPRPHTVAHNEYYRLAVKRYMVRHKVKPGLTGWAQVHGLRGETAQLERMEERIRYDLDYIRNWSPMLDFKIVLMTVAMIFRDRNAY
ncbi:undecaprenyl-phosphate glucose phosphotransferase [Panacagrimonas sp.]|uniref:undecaprenyl-phosphate glucose phosphotransferase n=1 Tax=Panacagrimonas sp. TaxID=2480088 RepID=UPI003B52649B